MNTAILAQHIASQDEGTALAGWFPKSQRGAHVEKLAPLIAATLAEWG
ncbi:hypothetical protein [Novosphingobium sp. Gsoil 351]